MFCYWHHHWKLNLIPLKTEPIMVQPNPVRILTLTGRHDGVMLQWTVIVESTNKHVFTLLYIILIYVISLLWKNSWAHLVRNWWIQQRSFVFVLLQWCYPIPFINIFTFVLSLIIYIFKVLNIYELTIKFPHSSQWKLFFLWVNKSLVLSLTSPLKVVFDPLETELYRSTAIKENREKGLWCSIMTQKWWFCCFIKINLQIHHSYVLVHDKVCFLFL